MQRLQVGLFGLAFVLLIVALANIIMERARLAESQAALPVATATAIQQASDPLAEERAQLAVQLRARLSVQLYLVSEPQPAE